MQLILVAIVIFWPQSVTYWLDKGPKVDLEHDQDRSTRASAANSACPPMGADGGNGSPQIPGLTLPPLNGLPGQQPAPATPRAAGSPTDLSQPPPIR